MAKKDNFDKKHERTAETEFVAKVHNKAEISLSAQLNLDHNPASTERIPLTCDVKIDPSSIAADLNIQGVRASICLLVDCSVSMIGKKFAAALNTAKLVASLLDEKYLMSLVAFESRSHIVFENETTSKDNLVNIEHKIHHLEDYIGGSTNLACGIDSAIKIFSNAPTDCKILLVISDGAPDSFKKTMEKAVQANEQGIQVHAVGIGKAYNSDQLLKLVAPSHGRVYADNEAENMDDIFRELVAYIDQVVAAQVKLRVKANARAKLSKLFKIQPELALLDIPQLPQSDENFIEISMGNMGKKSTHRYLFQYETSLFEDEIKNFFEIELTYKKGNGFSESEKIILTLPLKIEINQNKNKKTNTTPDSIKPFADESGLDYKNTLIASLANSDKTESAHLIKKNENEKEIRDKIISTLAQTKIIKKTQDDNKNLSKEEKRVINKKTEESKEKSRPKDLPDKKITTEVALKKDLPSSSNIDHSQEHTKHRKYEIVLIDAGSHKLLLMRKLLEIMHLPLTEIDYIVRSTQKTVYTSEKFHEVDRIYESLCETGAKLEIRAENDEKIKQQL